MKRREILRRTSRTFGLTLRLLPGAVRPDACLGYLLARATDTIADASSASLARRASMLRAARASLSEPAIAGYTAGEWTGATGAESFLLGDLPALWAEMQSRPARARDRLRRVLGHILEGQLFDLERFGPGSAALSESELEKYTYLVAGSVGEFWTDLCGQELPRFASVPEGAMREKGKLYGQGLQLVNILRDRAADAAAGRVYVAEKDVSRWEGVAAQWLWEGAGYCAALRPGRLRYASFLPALLGWRTLALAPSAAGAAPRKLSRAEVRRCVWRALPVLAMPRAVARLAGEASGIRRGR